MKGKFLISVVFAIGVVIVGAEFDELCEKTKNGVVSHPTDCRLFIHCVKGKGTIDFCNQSGKTPMYFDETLHICNAKHEANCTAHPKEPTIPERILKECKNLKEDTPVSDNKNCHEFYVCQDTWAYENSCPNGMHFSNETQSCGNPLVIGCKTLETMCHGEKKGFTFAALTCAHYYECSILGVPKLMECTDGLYYGMVAGKCVKPSESECTEGYTTAKPTTPSTHNPYIECALSHHGAAIADPNDKTKFYICTQHGPVHMDCPAELVFSNKDGFCELSKKHSHY